MGTPGGDLAMPYLRSQLIGVLRELADTDFQRRIWCRQVYDPKEWEGYSDFAHVVHFFYDDTYFFRDPEHYIGLCLYTIEEARVINTVINALNEIKGSIGFNVSDEMAIAHEKWLRVVEAARCALEALDDQTAG